MPVYRVTHRAIVTYVAYVAAPDKETAKGSESYGEVVSNQDPSDRYWEDSHISDEWEYGEEEADYYVGVTEEDVKEVAT